jgi:choline dehydrogenase-like flavoprotein
MESPLPSGGVRALIASGLVTSPTRAALLERLEAPPVEEPLFFTRDEFATLRAVCDGLLAREPSLPIDIAGPIDARLAVGEGDGWRFDELPPDSAALRELLRHIDAAAQASHGASFAQLDVTMRARLLTTLQAEKVWHRVWEELRAECAEVFYSHPLAQEEIGYAGFADARGWLRVGLDEPDEAETIRHETRDARHETQDADMFSPIPTLAPPSLSESSPAPFSRPSIPSGEEVDAVVIGTGAGGAPLLARLARAGLRVVALEAGRWWRPEADFATDERAQRELFWRDERLSAGDTPLSFGNNNSGTGVGGSTLHYTAYVPRAQPDDLRLLSEFGAGADWPLAYEDLEPYYEQAERLLGVSGPTPYPWGPPRRAGYPLPPLPLNGAAQLMQRGAAAIGMRTSPAPNAALSQPYHQEGVGWRRACTNRGFCQAGCSVGAKGSADVTFIPLAVAAGAEIRPGCFVTGIETGPDGRVTGVVYSHNGAEHRQRCKALFVCAGAIETPRLLLLNGLANSSGQVGRNLMAHTGLQLWAQFDETVRPYKGIPGALISEDTHRPPGADFAGGYLVQSIGVMPVTYVSQLARSRGLWGSELRGHMRGYNHVAGINMLGECLPHAHNYVELAEERDARGLPKPRAHFSEGENERRLTAHAELTMRAIFAEAGARDVWRFPRNAHLIGTCRMGASARDAVVNADGRSFDIDNLYIVDNSIFPSALSVNPALTIMALSLRAADRFLNTIRT